MKDYRVAYYTGIGSRETPESVMVLMTEVADILGKRGYTLRSGRAEGADSAFEEGATTAELYIPWRSFAEGKPLRAGHTVFVRGDDAGSRAIAETIHRGWHNLSRGAQALHSRNVNQILGQSAVAALDPSEFVLFYAPETRSGAARGGTATAVNLARSLNIPTLNLLHVSTVEEVLEWIDGVENAS